MNPSITFMSLFSTFLLGLIYSHLHHPIFNVYLQVSFTNAMAGMATAGRTPNVPIPAHRVIPKFNTSLSLSRLGQACPLQLLSRDERSKR